MTKREPDLAVHPEKGRLLTPGEVAEMFRVDVRTVWRWANEGTLPPSIKTLGGRRRYYERDIEAAVEKWGP